MNNRNWKSTRSLAFHVMSLACAIGWCTCSYVLGVGITLASSSQEASWPSKDAELQALGQKLLQSWFTATAAKDVKAAGALMQDGFQAVNFVGATDRGHLLADMPRDSGSLIEKATTISGLHATRVGDALVVACLASVDESVKGIRLPAGESPRMSVWQLSEGAWKMCAFGSLHMPSSRPAPNEPTFASESATNSAGEALLRAFIEAQVKKDLKTFDAMLADGMQSINFKGQKMRADLIKGADYATSQTPAFASIRATKCGAITVVTCNMSLGQKIGFTKLPAESAPFLVVFAGEGASAKVIATANTNKPD